MKELDMKEVGRTIKARRTYLGMTQQELADILGVGTQAIYYYEQGRSDMGLTRFLKTCDVLRMNPSEVLDSASYEK